MNARRVAILIALAVTAAVIAVYALQQWRTANDRAKLETRRGDAAVASGQVAVETVGNRAAADAASDAVSRENDAAIRAAPGADAKVTPEAHAAGLRALCRRDAYRETPRCASFR